MDLQDKGVIDSGCLRHMTRNMSYLIDYEEIDGGYVAFGVNPKGGKITRKCTIKTEAVNTAYYVKNKVLVVKPHNKTPYELFHGRTPTLSFMRPVGCPVTILNTLDHLGKFDSKADKGFFVGYLMNSKAFRVFNSRTWIVEKNLHIRFSENTPNVVGSGPDWLFDIDAITRTMNYEPIVAGTQSNSFADPKSSQDDGFKTSNDDGKKVYKDPRQKSECNDQEQEDNVNSTNNVNAVGTNGVNAVGELPFDPDMPALEYVGTLTSQMRMKMMGRWESGGEVSGVGKSGNRELARNQVIDEDGEEVDVYMYRLMIGSLTYLTSSRPDIMFAVCACARYQVNIKVIHIYGLKRIFRYLNSHPKLGLWYLKDSPFDLISYTDSDYAGARLDMKSTTRGCQYLRSRLIS
nr:uncharacterized mitochondrial protein AtMg00810-like [Tanacetum cinerariifolium]